MHGLVLRTLQVFVLDTYGNGCWADIAARASLEHPEFEAMLRYDPRLLSRILKACEVALHKPQEAVIEDVGTYLISHPNCESLRRLLRYGGRDFIDLLHSLEDLPGRARLAVPDFNLPDLRLREKDDETFELMVSGNMDGFGHLFSGMLRALADDYGALALVEHSGHVAGGELIAITVVNTDYSEGRDFQLGSGAHEKWA